MKAKAWVSTVVTSSAIRALQAFHLVIFSKVFLKGYNDLYSLNLASGYVFN